VISESMETMVTPEEEEKQGIPIQRRTWESADCTSSKVVLEEGDLDLDRPRLGSTGEVVVGQVRQGHEDHSEFTAGSKFFTRLTEVVEFSLGLAETAVDRGFERCLGSFLPGEKSRLAFKVFLEPGLNQRKSSKSSSPVWLSLECDVTLVSLVNAAPLYTWFPETKLAKAREAYSAGGHLFKQARFLDSFHLFQLAHKLAVFAMGVKKKTEPSDESDAKCIKDEKETDASPEILSEARQLRLNCCNNLAACHFQWGHHDSVVELSTMVMKEYDTMVEWDKQSRDRQVKALYRRGVSYMGLKEFQLAEKDLVSAHKLDPANRAVNEQLGQVQQRRKTAQTDLSQRMSKLFR